jgi:hypothetical protein
MGSMDDPHLASVVRRASVLLANIGHRWADAIVHLRPQERDYGRVFVDAMVGPAQRAYGTWWAEPPPPPTPRPEQTRLLVNAASPEALARGVGGAAAFPRGYRDIAGFLRPERSWVCWKLVAPGRSLGLAFDGLVDVGGRWVWIPKPFRMLTMQAHHPLAHFSE